MSSERIRVEIECSPSAAKNIMKIVSYFKGLGGLGSTAHFHIGDSKEVFTFDGDGEDQIYSSTCHGTGRV